MRCPYLVAWYSAFAASSLFSPLYIETLIRHGFGQLFDAEADPVTDLAMAA
jgi:hypothetical protein